MTAKIQKLAFTDYLAPSLGLLAVFLVLLPRMLGLNTVTDDYYYYERIARHIVTGAGSTYDGVVSTNGYHPLWLWCVVGSVLLEKCSGWPAQLWSLSACALSAGATVLVLARRDRGATLLDAAFAVVVAAYCVFFAVMAMETSLIVLLAALLFRRIHSLDERVDAVCGILCAACFLCRIDSLVYLALPAAYFGFRSSKRDLLAFSAIVLTTILLYGAVNEALFGIPVPISGAAKSVVRFSGIHTATWSTLLVRGVTNQLLLGASALLTTCVLTAGSSRQRRIALLSATGVVGYFLLNSLRSDWGIEEWYLYPVALHVILLAFGSTYYTDSPIRHSSLQIATLALAVAAFFLVPFRDALYARRQAPLVEAARLIKDRFAGDGSAVFAMGDRAGAVGEVLPNRLVQLEGLVMDRKFLQDMRSASSILSVLKDYGVDYYIATAPRPMGHDCYATSEPSQSHGYSMKLHSVVCAPIAADFTVAGAHTVVFSVGDHAVSRSSANVEPSSTRGRDRGGG